MIELIAVAGLVVLAGGIFLMARGWEDVNWLFGSGLAFLLVGVVVSILGIVALGTRASCRGFERQSGRETKWDLFAGCFVDVEGEWFPKDQLGDLRLRGELDND